MRRLLLAALLLFLARPACADQPLVTARSESRGHGQAWVTDIYADGTARQFVGGARTATVTMHLTADQVGHLRLLLSNVDFPHLVWAPAHVYRSGMMSLYENDRGRTNYVEWSGQPVDGPASGRRRRFARVWVEVLALVPSPNDWETPEFFQAWTR